jgi:hypothetical protein
MTTDVREDAAINYAIAVTVQRDNIDGVTIASRCGWARGLKPENTTQSAVSWLRLQTGFDSSEYRVVAYYVGPCVPCMTPTRYLISLTMMPGSGASFTARLRERHREFVISDELTVFDALNEMMMEESADCIIGYSVNPVQLD